MPEPRAQEPLVVVGADRRGARAVLTRAQQVCRRAIVVTTVRDLPDEHLDGFDAVDVIRVDHLSLEGLLRVARESDCGYVLVSGSWQRPVRMLRQGVVAAAAFLHDATMPYLALHMVRTAPEHLARPYRKVLVAADGAVGSGFAALVAARVASSAGAELQVALLDRRHDPTLRAEVERRAHGESGFEVEAVRSGVSLENEALEQARRHISACGVDADYGWVRADPATALLAAATTGGYGLVVSGMMGRQPGGRALGTPATLTREVLEASPVDHLVVFDSVSLGLSPPRRTAALVGMTATLLLGYAAVTAQQGSATDTASDSGATAPAAAAVADGPATTGASGTGTGTGWQEARGSARTSGSAASPTQPRRVMPPPRWTDRSQGHGGPDIPPPDDTPHPDVNPPDDIPGPIATPRPEIPPPDDTPHPDVPPPNDFPGSKRRVIVVNEPGSAPFATDPDEVAAPELDPGVQQAVEAAVAFVGQLRGLGLVP